MMKRLLLPLLLLIPTLLSAQSKTYESNFPLTENPISESSNWINGGATGLQWGNVQTTPGFVFGTIQSAGCSLGTPTLCNDNTATLAGSWNSSQWAKAVVKINGTISTITGHEVELRLRTTITANINKGYEINCNVANDGGPYIQIVRWNGALGNFTVLDQMVPAARCQTNDVLMASISGAAGATVLHVWLNGTLLTFTNCHCTNPTDTSGITTGSPGLGFFNGQDTTQNAFGFSHYEAGDAAGGFILAATPAQADISTALSAVAADNAVVIVPGGSITQTTVGNYTQTFSTTLIGQSDVVGDCMPTATTCTAIDNTTITTNEGVTQWNFHLIAGKNFRISGLTYNTTAGNTAVFGAIDINGPSTSFRMDHNHFNDSVSGNHTIQPDAWNGVIDHNYFDSTTSANLFFLQPTINGTSGLSNETWTVADAFGSSQYMYVENNFFIHGAFVFDCDFGGRIAFRYNITSTNVRIQTHGVGSGAERRGCRAMEVYNNTFTFSATPNTNSFAFLVDYESGTGLFWGNTITAFSTFLRQQEIRANNATYTQTASPAGWGYCGTAFNGTGTNWDENNPANTGYACLDMVGRGAGQLITGNFPSKVNNSTGTVAPLNQARVPVYAWLNTLNTNSFAPNHYWGNAESPVRPIENSDYYTQRPNVDNAAAFNGTVGTGSGLLSVRPATCTAGPGGNTIGVGYWATDTQTFYTCNPANTWTSYYQPYTYPHPLDTMYISVVSAPSISISPNPITFSNQLVGTTSSGLTVTITNVGTADDILATPFFTLTGTNASDFARSGGSCTSGATLTQGGGNCTIILTFTPAAIGSRTGTLNINGTATASASITGTGIQPVATPTFSPVAGTYGSAQTITISDSTGGATLCYTVDGSTPTANGAGTCTHGTTYVGTFVVSVTTTVKALGSEAGFTDSAVASATYVIQGCAAVNFNPVGSIFTSSVVVALSSGCTSIIFTTDGSTPTDTACSPTNGTLYTVPFTLISTATVKAISCQSGFVDSSVATQNYTITQALVPSIFTMLRGGNVILSGKVIN